MKKIIRFAFMGLAFFCIGSSSIHGMSDGNAWNLNDVVAFKFDDGSYLAVDSTTGFIVPLQTSLLNPVTHFRVRNYSSGYFTIRFGEEEVGSNSLSKYVSSDNADATHKFDQLRVQSTDINLGYAGFSFVYDSSANKMSFGFRGGSVQKNPSDQRGPVVVTLIKGVSPESYLFTTTVLGDNKKIMEGLSSLPSLTAEQFGSDLNKKFAPAFDLADKTAVDWKYLVDTLSDYASAASASTGLSVALNGQVTGLIQKAAEAQTDSKISAEARTFAQNYLKLPISKNSAAFCRLAGTTGPLTKDQVAAGLQVIDAELAELKPFLTALPGAGTFFVNSVVSYLKRASIVPEWHSFMVTNGASAKVVLSAYASEIVDKIIKSEGVFIDAKTALLGIALLFVQISVGDVITLQLSDGSYFMADGLFGTPVFKKGNVVSKYDSRAHFLITLYDASAGTISFSVAGKAVVFDGSLKLVADPRGTQFKISYDSALKTLRFGSEDKDLQFDSSGLASLAKASSGTALTMKKITLSLAQKLLDGAPLDTIANNLSKNFPAAFNDSPDAPGDWQYLVDALSAYISDSVQNAPGWTNPNISVVGSTNKVSLRDLAVDLFTIAFNNTLTPALSKTTAEAMIATLKDAPILLADPTATPAALSLPVGAVISLKISDGVYLSKKNGAIAAVTTHILDPAVHFVVRDYDTKTGRICLGFDSSFLRLSSDATRFAVTETKRFIDIVRDATNPNKFSFSYAGNVVSFAPQALGLTAEVPVQVFEVVALTPAQRIFDGLSAGALTVALIQSDIKNIFDPAFALLGTIPGDWDFFSKTFVAYLTRVSTALPSSWKDISISGVSAGALSLRDYVVGVFSSMFRAFSVAPVAVQDAARAVVAPLLTGSVAGSGTTRLSPTSSSPTISEGAMIALRIPSPTFASFNTIIVGVDGSLQSLPGVSKYLMAGHLVAAKYDGVGKKVILASGGKFFDKTSGKFIAGPLSAATYLSFEPVKVGGATYYYLNDGSRRLNVSGAQPSVVSFGTVGTLFDIVALQADDYILDLLADPTSINDVAAALMLFSSILDLVASDDASLAVVVDRFNEYCLKAKAISGWDNGIYGSSLGGAAPRDYARALLSVILTAPSYSGATADLKSRITQAQARDPFVALAASLPAGDKNAPVGSVPPGHPAFMALDGQNGVFAVDLPVFDAALRAARESTQDLATVLGAINMYVFKAAARLDWAAMGASGSASVPKNYLVALISRVRDNDWYFTGLTADLQAKIAIILGLATDVTAGYPAQFSQLSELAAQIISIDGLSGTSRLAGALSALIPVVSKNGTPIHRAALLSKIESFYDKKSIPALGGSVTDAQRSAWTVLMFGFECKVLQFTASTMDLLDEKLACVQGVLRRRVQLIDQTMHVAVLETLLDPFLKTLAADVAVLVKATPTSTDVRSQNLQKFLSYLDNLVKQLRDAQQDLNLTRASLDVLAALVQQVWVASGLKSLPVVSALPAVPVIPVSVTPRSSAPVVSSPQVTGSKIGISSVAFSV